MNTSLPPLPPVHPLPSGWGAGAVAPGAGASHPAGASLDWFAAPASASGRVLSAAAGVTPPGGHGRDVQAWADAVTGHLLAPVDTP